MKSEKEKNNHLIKNVPDQTWKDFRIMAIQNDLDMATALKTLVESYKKEQAKQQTEKSA